MTNYYTHEASCSGSSFLAAGVSPEASHDSMGCHGAGLVTGQREKDGFPKQGRGLLPLKRVRPDAGRIPCEDTETHRHRGKTHMKQRQNCAPTPQGSPGAPEAGRGEEAPPQRLWWKRGPASTLVWEACFMAARGNPHTGSAGCGQKPTVFFPPPPFPAQMEAVSHPSPDEVAGRSHSFLES